MVCALHGFTGMLGRPAVSPLAFSLLLLGSKIEQGKHSLQGLGCKYF